MKKINYIDSIRNPIITEKATILSEQNKTVFKVHEKANKKTINIGRMKVIKNIFCIVLKRCKDRVFLNKNKKGITPKIKIWDNKNVMPWKIFIFIWDRFAFDAVWDNVTNSLL